MLDKIIHYSIRNKMVIALYDSTYCVGKLFDHAIAYRRSSGHHQQPGADLTRTVAVGTRYRTARNISRRTNDGHHKAEYYGDKKFLAFWFVSRHTCLR